MKEPMNKNILNELLAQISPAEQKKTDKKMMLAAKLASAIKAKGLKKKEFAEKLGKRPSEISKWLSGTHNFTTDTLIDIEALLSVQLIDAEKSNPFENYEKVDVKPNLKKAVIYRLAS